MQRTRIAGIGLACLLMACAGSGGGGGAPTEMDVSGRVLDSRGAPVAGATVTIASNPVSDITDDQGRFAARIEVGDHTLTVTVGADDVATLDFSLADDDSGDLGDIALTTPFFAWYLDADGDGHGTPAGVTTTSTPTPAPVGYAELFDDCDDAAPSVHPGAAEVCNGLDDSCSGLADDGLPFADYYLDADGDGFGDPATALSACALPAGRVADGTDCDDTAFAIHPSAAEVCNGLDDSCSGVADDGLVFADYYLDGDGDGFGDPATALSACAPPAGRVTDGTDCDDTASAIHPGAAEVCNGLDDSCNGVADDGLAFTDYFLDADADGFGNPATIVSACAPVAGRITNGTDCDDAAASVHPGAPEVCNGVDDSCDGVADDGLPLMAFYTDADGDGFGDPLLATDACAAPAGTVADGTDCDDFVFSIHPGAPEVCNGLDDSCSGVADDGLVFLTYYTDADGDGFGDPATAVDACDPVVGAVLAAGDCDDTDPALNPDTRWYADADGDGYPGAGDWVASCLSPAPERVAGFDVAAFDCDDANAAVNPAANEVTGNGLDDDCDAATTDFPPFVQADVAGDYALQALTIGDTTLGDWIGWERGDVGVGPEGHYTRFHVLDSDGELETVPPPLAVILFPNGLMARTDVAAFTGAMATDGGGAATVAPDAGTSLSLTMVERTATGFTQADLEGTWHFHGLAGGGEPRDGYAFHGTHTVDADGIIATERFIGVGGEVLNDVAMVGDDGRVVRGLASGAEYHFSANGDLLVGTYSSEDVPPRPEMEIAVRSGVGHTLADLAGDWTFVALVSGGRPGVNATGHGVLRVDGAGHAVVVYQEWSAPDLNLPGGDLAMTDDGEVTHAGLPGFIGHVSRDRDALVATVGQDTEPKRLLVAHRRRVPPTVMLPDTATAATALIGTGGGTLAATGADGTLYTLVLPPDALGTQTEVSLIPVAGAVGDLPVGTPLGQVLFRPDGLELRTTAVLTIEPPGPLPAELLGFSHRGTGADAFAFQPAPAVGNTVALGVLHFSGIGAVGGTAAGQSDPDAAFLSLIKYYIEVAVVNNIPFTDSDLVDAVTTLVENWRASSLDPRLGAATNLPELQDAYTSLLRAEAVMQLWAISMCEDFGVYVEPTVDLANTTADRLLSELDAACIATPDSCTKYFLMQQAFDWRALVEQTSSCLTLDLPDLAGVCGGASSYIPAAFRIVPAESGVALSGTISLEAAASYLNADTQPLLSFWTPLTVGTIDISPEGATPGVQVTGQALGMGIVQARAVGMESCENSLATVYVNPDVADPWNEVTLSRMLESGITACEAVPDPILVQVSMDGGTAPTHPSAAHLSWEGSRTSLPLNRDAMDGGVLGQMVEVSGAAYWPEQAGEEAVLRTCHLRLSHDHTVMRGTCDFDWTGEFLPDVGFTGCHGTDTVRIERFIP
jgi:hypothetical protein